MNKKKKKKRRGRERNKIGEWFNMNLILLFWVLIEEKKTLGIYLPSHLIFSTNQLCSCLFFLFAAMPCNLFGLSIIWISATSMQAAIVNSQTLEEVARLEQVICPCSPNGWCTGFLILENCSLPYFIWITQNSLFLKNRLCFFFVPYSYYHIIVMWILTVNWHVGTKFRPASSWF